MTAGRDTPIGLRLGPDATIELTPPAAAALLGDLLAGGRHIRLVEGAALVIDDVRAGLAITALRSQLPDVTPAELEA